MRGAWDKIKNPARNWFLSDSNNIVVSLVSPHHKIIIIEYFFLSIKIFKIVYFLLENNCFFIKQPIPNL